MSDHASGPPGEPIDPAGVPYDVEADWGRVVADDGYEPSDLDDPQGWDQVDSHAWGDDDGFLGDHGDDPANHMAGLAAPAAVAVSSRRELKNHRNRRKGRRGLVLLVTLGLLAAAAYVGLSVVRPMFSGSTNDYPGPGTDPVTFTVNSGDTGRTMGANLEKAGVVKTAKAFVDAFTAEPKSAAIQPGAYALKKEMKAVDALAVLVDPKNRQVPKVTIREGLWATEIYSALAKATGKPISDYEAAAKDAAALGLPADAKGNIEGYLFPATYEFSSKNSAAEQLRTMVAKTVSELAKLGVTAQQAPRVLSIASIVEAEASRADDRPKVARVIENRLAAGMRLQLDSTVSYGVKHRAITTTDAERADPNTWNTYLNNGLPSGPISNPGVASIQAALNPAAGDWLFFVAVNPEFGETKFTASQAEHDRNVAEFQAWCQKPENQGKCSR
ncbi:MAG: endolytic transglycosylase MltG [Actinomycetales bacterium]|nr:endolytic transglycosylase MltG [Actinomycetales bacterium]